MGWTTRICSHNVHINDHDTVVFGIYKVNLDTDLKTTEEIPIIDNLASVSELRQLLKDMNAALEQNIINLNKNLPII